MSKNVVITGATKGIGKACAYAFAEAGYNVAIIYHYSDEQASEIVQDLRKYNVLAERYKCNVSDFEACRQTFGEIYQVFPEIDVLINNAGIIRDKLFIYMKPEDFHEVMNVNVKGTFNCAKMVMKKMHRKKKGKVINIASIAGMYGSFGQSNYSCAKAGIIAMTKTLAKEYANDGINVNCISPGFINTDMTNSLSEAVKEEYISKIPANRAGQPNEVAQLALFLASDNANYINGANINIDGGLTL